MAIYLCHQSALRYWLTMTGDRWLPDVAPDASLARASANMREIKRTPLPLEFSEDRPLHVLVPSRQEAHALKGVVAHVWKAPLPQGAFFELSGGNRVCSPEFAFLQMCARRPLVSAIELGCYLCGSFAVGDEGHGYAGERIQLTTPGQIELLLDALPGQYGTARARAALPYVVAGTASPMEVFLAMVFVLPPMLGGWGMPEVVANQRIDVDENLRALAEASYYKGDLYLPSVRGNVEYDSYEFHTGSYRLDHTQARRNVLEAMGVRTISATWGQVGNFEQFEAFMWMVRKRFGLPRREFDLEERAAQRSLHRHLTSQTARLF